MSAKDVAVGDIFGRLNVLRLETRADGTIQALCECKCGTQLFVRAPLLRCGITRSCGCIKGRAKDLTDMRFGRLTVLEPVPERGQEGSIQWKCRCDCGSEAIVSSNKLLLHSTKSCGCLQKSVLRTSRTYVSGTCLEIIHSTKLSINNTSGIKGVAKKRNKWQAYIQVCGKQYALGIYPTRQEAETVRKLGEQARTRYVFLTCARPNEPIRYLDVLGHMKQGDAVWRRESIYE